MSREPAFAWNSSPWLVPPIAGPPRLIRRTTPSTVAINQAHALAQPRAWTSLAVPELTRELEMVLGPRLIAVIVDLPNTAIVHSWSTGRSEPSPDVVKRLRQTAEITATLLAAENEETVRSWFLGMNPALDDQAPALALATDPARVLLAARHFAANG